MSKRSTLLSVASGPLKTAKASSKMSNTSSPPQTLSPPTRRAETKGSGKASPPKKIPSLGNTATQRNTPHIHDVTYAPAAVSMQGSNIWTHVSGSFETGMRVRFRAPFMQIYNYSGSVSSGNVVPALYGAGSDDGKTITYQYATSVAFNPCRLAFQASTNTSTANFKLGVLAPSSKYIPMLSNTFTQWRHTSDLRFFYEPGLNSDNSTQFFLQWVGDAANPVFGLAATSVRVLTQTDVDDVPHVAMFAGWAPMCLDVPTTRDWKYMFTTPQYVADGTTGGYSPAEVRDTSSGLLSVGSLRPDTSATYQTGLLFVEGEFEYRDPCPATVSLLLTRSAEAMLRFDGAMVRELDEEGVVERKRDAPVRDPPDPEVCSSPVATSASAPYPASDELSFDKDVALIAASPVLRRAFAVAAATSSSSPPSVRAAK